MRPSTGGGAFDLVVIELRTRYRQVNVVYAKRVELVVQSTVQKAKRAYIKKKLVTVF